jgi:WD40 repeat protein
MALISTSGEVLMHQDLLHRETFRKLVHSADGRRFALSLDKGKGGSAALDIAPHYSLNRIMVYDLAAREWIYTLDPKKAGIKDIRELALSPDGSLLGLITQDGTLEVYSLPAADTHDQR